MQSIQWKTQNITPEKKSLTLYKNHKQNNYLNLPQKNYFPKDFFPTQNQKHENTQNITPTKETHIRKPKIRLDEEVLWQGKQVDRFNTAQTDNYVYEEIHETLPGNDYDKDNQPSTSESSNEYTQYLNNKIKEDFNKPFKKDNVKDVDTFIRLISHDKEEEEENKMSCENIFKQTGRFGGHDNENQNSLKDNQQKIKNEKINTNVKTHYCYAKKYEKNNNRNKCEMTNVNNVIHSQRQNTKSSIDNKQQKKKVEKEFSTWLSKLPQEYWEDPEIKSKFSQLANSWYEIHRVIKQKSRMNNTNYEKE